MNNRVNYFERQFLRTQDFRDEQAYHIAMRRRHPIAHHTWGIVRGLELHFDEVGQQFYVQPGVAIDGYGRELLLPERLQISGQIFDELGSDRLDVNLYYGIDESDPPPRGYVECDNNGFYRAQERVYMRLVRAQPDADPRCPRDVPQGDLDFNPARMPPDSPLNAWPVFVGQLVRDIQGNISAVQVGRPYAGLVGEFIQTPSRLARLVVGDTPDANNPNSRRFAVFLGVQPDDPCVTTPAAEPQMRIVTHAALQEEDSDRKRMTTQVDILGETTIHGNVAITGGALRVEAEADLPDYPQPWRVYRVTYQETEKIKNKDGKEVEVKQDVHEMRVEMSNEENSEVVIGAWSAKEKKFKPCLTVNSNCEVIVHGKLIARNFLRYEEPSGGVRKRRVAAPASLYSAGLTPEAQAAVSGILVTGIAGAVYRPYALARTPQPASVPAVHAMPSRAETLADFVDNTDEADIESVIEELSNLRPDLEEKIRTLRTAMTDRLRKWPGI